MPTIRDVINGENDLPTLQECEPGELKDLMVKKLRLCCVHFQFKPSQDDIVAAIESEDQEQEHGKEAKRALLVELTQLVMNNKRQWFSEKVLVEVLHMTASNLFRALPPAPYDDWDPEEDDAVKDPAWLHIQMVYEFLFYFIVSQQVKPELVHMHLSEGYLQNLIELFRTKDIAEREYLKNIVHRIYQRFLGFRPFLRKAIGEALWGVTYTDTVDDGVGELLEIWGTVVSGFSVPLREEHLQFLNKILIPLHKNRCLKHYHTQLGYCILQYVDKDPSLSGAVMGGLLKYWPQQSSEKEQLFIQELEEVLDLASRPELVKVLPALFEQIGRSIQSQHFQVSERALFLWNKDVVATVTADHRDIILPILFPAITQKHWNSQVNELSGNIIRMFKEMDPKLWARSESQHQQEEEVKSERRGKRKGKWAALRKLSEARTVAAR